MAAPQKPCYGVQSWGKLFEGWVTLSNRESREEAEAGMRRVLAPAPGQVAPPREKFRVVKFVQRNGKRVAVPVTP